jgi:hypothetical protein
MNVVRTVAVVALLTVPAYAQMPQMNLLQDNSGPKTPEQKAAEEATDKAYQESLKKIPDAEVSKDPWSNVRGEATPKASAPAKPRATTGSTANWAGMANATGAAGCAYHKSNPGILMMQSAQDWLGDNASGRLDGAWYRCILVQW